MGHFWKDKLTKRVGREVDVIIKGVMRETGFPGAAVVKALLASAGDTGDTSSIPGRGTFPGDGNGDQLQYSCLENLMDRERVVCWTTVYGVAKKSDMT